MAHAATHRWVVLYQILEIAVAVRKEELTMFSTRRSHLSVLLDPRMKHLEALNMVWSEFVLGKEGGKYATLGILCSARAAGVILSNA